MSHPAHSGIPADWLADWLFGDRSQDVPFGLTQHSEAARPEDIEIRLAEMIYRAKTSEDRLARLLRRVGWMTSSARLEPPTNLSNRLGDFGEIVAIGLIEVFKGAFVPVVKLRYQMDKDQSLHGTDIVAFVFDATDGARIASLEFCEVKTSTSTKYNARDAVGAAHSQLAVDRKIHFTDTLELLAERLGELSPELAHAFEHYLISRLDESMGSSRIVLLVDPIVYDDIVLDLIPEPPDQEDPLEVDVVQVGGLRELVEAVWPQVNGRAAADARTPTGDGRAVE